MAERITDIGPPHFSKFLPPVIKDNYGKWKYHQILEPGVLVHVSETGAEIYSVRIASPRLITTMFARELCDLADKYCGGHLRFTSRHNCEFLVSDKSKLEGLKADLVKRASPRAAPATPLPTSSTPRVGSTATPRLSTPPGWSKR